MRTGHAPQTGDTLAHILSWLGLAMVARKDSHTPLKRNLSLFSMVMAVITSTIGSGWLFAPYFAAQLAGPASLLSWGLAGVMAYALALVFAELGALVSSSGSLAQIPLLSHGRLSGFIGGWSAWIAYVTLPSIEVMATMDYLSSTFPVLTQHSDGDQVLSATGLGLSVALLAAFAWINLAGVVWLARWINGLTLWKLLIPVLASVTLMFTAGHWQNLSPFLPAAIEDSSGVLRAMSAGGILFSLLGFRTAMDLAGEAKDPQRTVPLAMALGLGISLAIYLLLQLAFLVAVPPEQLGAGWNRISFEGHGGPLVAIAAGLGLTWVISLLIIDAAVSPSATSMAYMGAAARVNWMMGRSALLPAVFGRTNRAGVPSVAVLSSLVVGVVMLLLPGGWSGAVSFLTAALIIALSMGPVCLWALRRQLPQRHRPYRLPFSRTWCVVSFVMSSWAAFWNGWDTLLFAVLAIVLPSLIFLYVEWRRGRPVQFWSGAWWFAYLGGLCIVAGLFGDDRPFMLPLAWQLTVVGAFAVVIFPFAVRSRLDCVAPEAALMMDTDARPAHDA